MPAPADNPYADPGLVERVARRVVGRRREILAIIAALAAGRNVLLEGPPGTTKSTILRAIAEESRVPFFMVEGSADLTPQKLIGVFNPAKVMAEGFKPEFFEPGPLTRAMLEGGLLYIEEFNRMPEDAANALIRAAEERELVIPRYGVVRARPSFRIICAMNPYDDVGTGQVSRALLDRFCRLRLDYQSRAEEIEIVRLRTGCRNRWLVELAVDIARETRRHPALKMGSSVRGAIDMVMIVTQMARLKGGRLTFDDLLDAAVLAYSSKIWVNDPETRPEDVIREVLLKVLSLRGFRSEELYIPIDEELQAPDQEHGEGAGAARPPSHDKTRAAQDAAEGPGRDGEAYGHAHSPRARVDEVRKNIDVLWRMAQVAPFRVSLELASDPDLLMDLLEEGVKTKDARVLELYAYTYPRLCGELRPLARRYARELIIRLASEAAGRQRGGLRPTNLLWDWEDIDVDRTIERVIERCRVTPDELVVYARERKGRRLALIVDRSASMAGFKIVLAAFTAALLAYAMPVQEYAVLAFNTEVSVLKPVGACADVESVVDEILRLEPRGYTDIAKALQEARKHLGRAPHGILVTDGEWTAGENPLKYAPSFRRLDVIGVPSKWVGFARAIAIYGHGRFVFIRSLTEAPRALRGLLLGA